MLKYKWGYNTVLTIVLLVLIITMGLVIPNRIFFRPSILMSSIADITYLGLMALAMTFIIITGGIDLSVGHMMSVSAMVMSLVLTNGGSITSALCASLVTGGGCGLLNGLIITSTRIPPLIVTLSTMTIFQGVTWLIGGTHSLTGDNIIVSLGSGSLLGISNQIICLLFVFFIFDVLQTKMALGRYIKGIGFNENTVRFSGISNVGIKNLIYSLCGVVCAFAGILFMGRGFEVNTTTAINMNLEVITLVVLGGTSTAGGIGTVRGTFLATLVIGVLRKGLSLLGYSGDVYNFVLGAILIISLVGLAYLQEKAKIASRKISV